MCAAPAFYYFIKSQLNGMVLDVESSITSPGALVSMWEKNGTDAQIWYDDPATGTIRNKLNGFCMDIKGGRLVMNPYQVGKQDQLWERKGNAIVDRRDRQKVLDIADSNGGARAKVIKNLGSGAPNQSWTFELV